MLNIILFMGDFRLINSITSTHSNSFSLWRPSTTSVHTGAAFQQLCHMCNALPLPDGHPPKMGKTPVFAGIFKLSAFDINSSMNKSINPDGVTQNRRYRPCTYQAFPCHVSQSNSHLKRLLNAKAAPVHILASVFPAFLAASSLEIRLRPGDRGGVCPVRSVYKNKKRGVFYACAP